MPANESGTEKDIVDLALEHDGTETGGAEDASLTGQEAEGAGEGGAVGADGDGDGGGANTAAAGQQGGKGNQQQQTEPPPQDQNAPRPGDLVDQRTGQVLARSGAERRIFERASRYLDQHYAGQMQGLQAQVEAYQNAHQLVAQHGLDPSEISYAYQLLGSFKRDPVKTVEFLLTQVRAAGHNIEGVGGTDTAAIAAMIDQRLQPLLGDREAIAQEQALHNEVEQEYTAFVSQFPDAVTHEADIAQLIERNPRLTPSEAYFRLQNFALRNGLDWSKPLQAQFNARQGGQQQDNRGNTRGLPTGRGGAVPRQSRQAQNGAAHELTPTRDIVKDAMRAAGYTI
jgi:hypothetical protein